MNRIFIFFSFVVLLFSAEIAFSHQDSSSSIFVQPDTIPPISDISIEELRNNKDNTIILDGPVHYNSEPPLWVINGKIFNIKLIDDFKPKYIDSISVLHGSEAIEKYGKAGKDVVILIQVKEKYFDILLKIKKQEKKEIAMLLQNIGPTNTTLVYDSLLYSSKDSTVLVAFYRQKVKHPGLVGKLFVRNQSRKHYREITIDTILHEGGVPRIEAFFTENIDQDKSTEFIVLVSWPVRHYTVNGTLYDTFTYDNFGFKNHLEPLPKINNKLNGGCDCSWRDGRTNEVTIKTEAAIKNKLEELDLLYNP